LYDDGIADILGGHGAARFTILDTRPEDDWKHERAAGPQVNIPLARLDAELPRAFPDRDASLILFGTDEAATNSARRVLRRLGYEHVLVIPEGFPGWRARKLPVTTRKV
jgi:rhodanese-related sulfurtransferase